MNDFDAGSTFDTYNAWDDTGFTVCIMDPAAEPNLVANQRSIEAYIVEIRAYVRKKFNGCDHPICLLRARGRQCDVDDLAAFLLTLPWSGPGAVELRTRARGQSKVKRFMSIP